ncbi:helix-turn-helix domain-containing protein [Candidatus Woesebacteria bacterium]|nr:helix-turn-helix domain-containing protein [Candidatus Woesebacteria bacterium]MCD8507423.1 helix-turn-helix domain-containing protein [Candidatus Woesebacteria bacterium]MCD8526885.1 helix-turn-helix domain-containing protein [Candidatus Woesebacteria bacterium]MCD8545777.1 helix-turn-helix domain-containing protein [Candidatus Woesebacteria bacterium]
MSDQQHPYTIQAFKSRLNQVGERIKIARQARGMTQGDLGKVIGISSKTISAIEVGRVEPSITQMQALSAVLEEPIGYFVGETASSVESKIERVTDELEEIRKLIELTKAKQAVQ